MSEPAEKRTLAPHTVIIAVIVIVILAVLFWPSGDDEENVETQEPVTSEQDLVPEEPEVFEPTPEPEPVAIDPDADVEPMPETTTPEPEPEPMDIGDEAIKRSLESINDEENVNRLLVDEGLLQRFVASVTNLANDEMAPGQQLFKAPEQTFRTYNQADKEWIDAASYKRYTPYVDMLERFNNEELLDLYRAYSGDIQAKYAEIGDPDKPFNEVMIEAIDQLLDTPEVPVPVEVYTDSVNYKFADPKLENLSSPQKQLLRTGPDNMRRIKAKLREVKALLQERNESQ